MLSRIIRITEINELLSNINVEKQAQKLCIAAHFKLWHVVFKQNKMETMGQKKDKRGQHGLTGAKSGQSPMG